ncbi:NAD(P)-dependent oxidoreductase [Pollutimonas sp. M17]|uniref:NAD(P)-dependent oxidoreductase n=1 Tax=Pollutimonas sp. M17 TaxID=2962065 RepID=UPI0021F45D6B|nr:NAD(P)-dependent oxidoreductase [Pollutimonas sp. M17]UYO93221.1 NAD(P)-binding domain-containing protein [Pollutimonas sp. M17]HWK72357.1 NAD(P)-dependent oxidoreductase [Burkholderiaceae bacterium]
MSAILPKVLLTNSMQAEQQARLAAHAEVIVAPRADADTLRALVADADVLVVRAKLPDDIFDYQTRLKGVVRHGVGLDMIPMEQATARKIPVANMPGSNTASVVEYCINAMFHLQRNMSALALRDPVADWAVNRPRADGMRELNGQTLGIVGVGTIGGALAKVAAAMGMKVLGLSRRPASLPEGVAFADKQTLFAQADIIVLACPLTAETRKLADAPTLALMKSGAILINVSRGPVVDTAALMAALEEGRIGGAALDVHDAQPIPAGLYPAGLERLLLTPHVAGITESSMTNMSRGTADEVLRLLQGQRFANLVNPEVYE